jgi:hypothetical protein
MSEIENNSELKERKVGYSVLDLIFSFVLIFYKPFVVCYIYNLVLALETGYTATYSVVFALFIIKMFLIPFDYNTPLKKFSEKTFEEVKNKCTNKIIMFLAWFIIHTYYYLIY